MNSFFATREPSSRHAICMVVIFLEYYHTLMVNMCVYNCAMQLHEMPPASIVNTPQTYHEMVDHLSSQPDIAIDTESNSLYAYREQVCLMQLSSRERDFLVDTLVFDHLYELGALFADAQIQKVFHAGEYDLATLKRDFSFEFHNVFDTMLAATALAEPNLGLAALLVKYMDVQVDKKYQRANWGERPLKPDMLTYAQGDSHYLLALRDLLVPQLQETGRLASVLEDSEALARQTLPMKDHEENLWRVRGAQDLKLEALSLLQALNHMREHLAKKGNRPPFKVLSDSALVDIARVQPKYPQELGLLPSLSQGQARRYGNDIMRAIREWREHPYAVKPRPFTRISEAEIRRRERLSDWRKETGLKEGVPSNVILPKEMLEKLAAKPPRTLEDLEETMRYTPHRYQQYGEAIFTQLKRKDS